MRENSGFVWVDGSFGNARMHEPDRGQGRWEVQASEPEQEAQVVQLILLHLSRHEAKFVLDLTAHVFELKEVEACVHPYASEMEMNL